MSFPNAVLITDANKTDEFDALLLISHRSQCDFDAKISEQVQALAQVDARIGEAAMLVHCPAAPGERLIVSPPLNLLHDVSDVRQYADAAKKGIEIAKDSGATKVLIAIEGVPNSPQFDNAKEVAYLAACQALWQPLEAREVIGEEKLEPIQTIGIFDAEGTLSPAYLEALEDGRRLARDLCGTEPERMAPPKFADYCVDAFRDSIIQVEIEKDQDSIKQRYPVLAAVGRASLGVTRHQPRVVTLTYEPEGQTEETLLLVGKGITYDTGGADLKVGGHMAGMSRDKGGAAAVAGFMKTLSRLKPQGLKVVARLGVVRNSIGVDAYVADEIITGHSGKRIRVGNTDAEGRMIMCDLLSHFREQAVNETNPTLFTVATLTGHAALAVGPYTIFVENSPARVKGVSTKLQEAGEMWGDGAEISRSRREDWHIIRPRSSADDVLSSNNGPSVSVARGHQFPMAFLSTASGLDEHGQHSEKPIPYVHVDIAGSGIDGSSWQHDKPTGSPILALAARYIKP